LKNRINKISVLNETYYKKKIVLPTRFCPAGQLGNHRTLSTFGFLPSHKSNPKKSKELNFPTAPKKYTTFDKYVKTIMTI